MGSLTKHLTQRLTPRDAYKGVFLDILAYGREIDRHGDLKFVEDFRVSNTRQLQNLR